MNTRKADWVKVGDACVATVGDGKMVGKVTKIREHVKGIPTATIAWSNGNVGYHTIWLLRKVT